MKFKSLYKHQYWQIKPWYINKEFSQIPIPLKKNIIVTCASSTSIVTIQWHNNKVIQAALDNLVDVLRGKLST